jgi:predicted nuclease of predicted toxin-antitoxin system
VKFLLDHDVPVGVLGVLRREGHEARRTTDILGAGAADLEIIRCAVRRRAIIITCNRDHFLALAKSNDHAGIIVLVRRRSRVAEAARLLALLRRAGENGIAGNLNFA